VAGWLAGWLAGWFAERRWGGMSDEREGENDADAM